MRANKVMNYTSILQVLGEAGCPFCRFMKDFQAAALQKPGGTKIRHLCNFHAWGFVATQRAPFAAELFLSLLNTQADDSTENCDICAVIWQEEDLRIREFISCLDQKHVSQWLRSQAVLCIAHGTKLERGSPPIVAALIRSVMERYRKQLTDDLMKLRNDYNSDRANWGLLGHVAEFLVSQRGLHA